MSEELTEFVIHNGEHSLYFSTTLDFSETLVSAMKGSHDEASKANTWFDWYIVPSSRPSIAQPTPKEERLDLPGANGDIDLTSILTGYPVFNNRTGTIEFTAMNTTRNWSDRYSKIASFLNGQKMYMILLDDPLWYYEGRFTINDWESDPKWSKISVSYTLYPYKRSLTKVNEDYLWDSLDFDDGIIIQKMFTNLTIDISSTITSTFPDVLGTGALSGTVSVTENGETVTKTAPQLVQMFLDWCETESVDTNISSWNLFINDTFGSQHLYPMANGYSDVLGYGNDATDAEIQENVDIIMDFVDGVSNGTYTDDATGWTSFLSDEGYSTSTASKPDIVLDASDAAWAKLFYSVHQENPSLYPQTQSGWNSWCRDNSRMSSLGMFPDANEDGVIDASDELLIRTFASLWHSGTYAATRAGWDSFRRNSSSATVKYAFPMTRKNETLINEDDIANISNFLSNNTYVRKDEKDWWNFSGNFKVVDFCDIFNENLSNYLRYEPVYISIAVYNTNPSKGMTFNFINTNDGTDETATLVNTQGFLDIQDWVVSVTGAPNEQCKLIATADVGSGGLNPKFDISFRLGVL